MVININRIFIFLSIVTFCVQSVPIENDFFDLHIVHLNDFHARFDETNESGGECKKPPCIGGYARVVTKTKEILKEKPNSLLLNAGDNFQGTLYYNLFKYNITATFLNKLPFDAITLGNHEFDDGLAGVVPFIKMLKAPVVLSNMDDSFESSIQGLYQKSIVVEREGRKIGIIGVIVKSTDEISNTERLLFYDESESVNEEAERLVNEEGVFTNIILSHSGYGMEKLIAKKAKNKISVIVGGHSHSFLFTGSNPPGPAKPEGPYPTVIKTKEDEKTVLVTQASSYCRYLGNITVRFNGEGDVVSWEGEPIFLDTSIPKDPEIDEALQPWKQVVDAKGDEVIGTSLVRLERDDCRQGECMLGDFVTDGFVYAHTKFAKESAWTTAAICISNTGSLRTTISKGNITFNDLIIAQPFENKVFVGDVTGSGLMDIFEFSATPYFFGRNFVNINLLQVSGVHIVIDISKPVGHRITSLKLRCADCEIPIYEQVDLKKSYKLIVSSFLLRGGDGFDIVTERMQNITETGVDINLLVDYVREKSPIFQEEEGRIQIIGEERIVSWGLND